MSRLRGGRPGLVAFLLLALASAARAETVRWDNTFDFYGDDVESFTPYRIDGTFLTGQYKSWLDVQPATGTHFLLGFFMEHLSGSTQFADRIQPVLSLRLGDESDQFIMGTLETKNRHGLLEVLEVPQLDFLRPMEYGLQWLSKHDEFHADVFMNWSQLLKIGAQREQVRYGGMAEQRLAGPLWLEAQTLSFHQGGELAGVGIVANNVVGGGGLKLQGSLGALGPSELAAYRLFDHDSFYGGSVNNGSALFVKGGITPWRGFELFASYFHGYNWVSADGDQNYNSVGYNNSLVAVMDTYYEGSPVTFGTLNAYLNPQRDVEELAVVKKAALNDYTTLEFEEHNQWVEQDFVWWFRVVGRVRFDRLLW